MKRISTVAAVMVLAAGMAGAQAATLTKDSPIGTLVGLVVSMQACGTQPTPDQTTKLASTGEALQQKLGATNDDLDALSKQFGDGKPAQGCERFNADFGTNLDAAVAAAQ